MEEFKKLDFDKISNVLNSSYVTFHVVTDVMDALIFFSWEIYKGRNVAIISDRTEVDAFKKRLSERLSSIAFDEYLSGNINEEERTRYIHKKEEIVQELVKIKKCDDLEGEDLKAMCESLARSSTTKIILLDLKIFQQERTVEGFNENSSIIRKIAKKHQKRFFIIENEL